MAAATTPEDQGADNKRGRPGSLSRLLWWANKLLVVLLLVTYLTPRTDPQLFWPLALLSFTYPYQLLLHAGAIAWWLVFRRRRIWLSLVAVLLGWGHVGDHYQFFGRKDTPSAIAGTPVKVISWNVRLFDRYNWTDNKESRDAIFDKLKTENADILCMQEFFHSPDKRYFRTKDALLSEFRYGHVHDQYTNKARNEQHFGIATFSVHPILARGAIVSSRNPNNLCIWSDIVIGADTIRVYNAHLASYHFGDKDHSFISNIGTDMERTELETGGRRIVQLLRDGIRSRSVETKEITAHMRTSPHPVVYCGDLNDVPMSYSYHQLRDRLNDAFVISGKGTGGTYIGDLPRMRIDHIMHDDRIASWGFITHPEEHSDHRAVSCWLGVR